MSGTSPAGLPNDAAGREAMAGEYVLGTLDARNAARVTVAMQSDPAWREAVAAWEDRLAPLAALARPEAPPPNVWDRIETRIAPAESPRQKRERRWSWLWRGWAIGATLATAGLAAFVFYPRAETRMMTVLVADRNMPGIMAEVGRRGDLRLNTVPAATGRQLQAPSGRTLQVWGLAPGAQAPTSLAVLPHEPGKVITIPASRVTPVPGMLIEISVEPEGGSPTGRPTGPVVFIGRLTLAGPDS
jgi:anti-sigma-K factor RskA